MKRYVEKVVEETTTEIGRFCGGKLSDGHKCILLYFGESRNHAVTNEEATINCSLGFRDCDFETVEDFVQNINKKGLAVIVEQFYMFDSLAEMLKWFAE